MQAAWYRQPIHLKVSNDSNTYVPEVFLQSSLALKIEQHIFVLGTNTYKRFDCTLSRVV